MTGRFSRSADTYRKALAIIEDRYGKGSDYYQITKANLDQAQAAADKNGDKDQSDQAKQAAPSQPKTRNQNDDRGRHGPRTDIQGLDLAKAYWEQVGRPMLEERYPQYRSRIAVGLMGHGSDCYGFDDATSRDHDFGPGFCLWLTSEDYQAIGDQLQKDYEALPTEFMGFGSRTDSVRAKGALSLIHI